MDLWVHPITATRILGYCAFRGWLWWIGLHQTLIVDLIWAERVLWPGKKKEKRKEKHNVNLLLVLCHCQVSLNVSGVTVDQSNINMNPSSEGFSQGD